MAHKEITWKIQMIGQKDITVDMENPDDGRDAFRNERTSRSFRKEKWPLAMVHHARCEMKNGPKFKLT